MKINRYETEEEWLAARVGRITGTRAGGLFSKRDGTPLKQFYEIIAERVAIPQDGENVMDRGKRLEDEAIERFGKETGKDVGQAEKVLCYRDDNENIAYSPDRLLGETEDIEVKCLNSAAHIEAYITKQIPSEYLAQIVQGFVVNDKLQTRYMVFYDPRMPKDFFYLTITRQEMEEDIEIAKALQDRALRQMAEIEAQLTF